MCWGCGGGVPGRYGYPERCGMWRRAAADRRPAEKCRAELTTVTRDGVEHTVAVLTAASTLALPSTVVYTASFVVHGSGHVEAHHAIVPRGPAHAGWIRTSVREDPGDRCNSIPRVGWRVGLPAEFAAVAWHGRGPHETYADRATSGRLGVWSGTVRGQLFPYVRPQETGNKVGVRWVAVHAATARVGLLVAAAGSPAGLSVSALPLPAAGLDGGPTKAQTHAAELPAGSNSTVLQIDFRQTGLGGVDSWGADPLAQYQIALPRTGHRYSFWLSPFRGANATAAAVAAAAAPKPPCLLCRTAPPRRKAAGSRGFRGLRRRGAAPGPT